ncbi:ABC transporter permease [Streptomyces spectabilis]|uniref:Transport permease protein n=1 Tax=Streptomyces spectabilis TaxID=68270 RepID=A0A5P2XB90_STRST|nr:ABC transporter permease [Streptomyces spectabilis]MBB5104385.1 ABC-2 type transport system permease protein [Streptomyces spectabilis]MCI3905258.1 ABC transporter permease [Streptomyces spectabilis]QEV62267.1 ABC transporter permease [Streptomyces spectabilis]GGU99631.1 transport permease protein [Streptomyces spectabilis]
MTTATSPGAAGRAVLKAEWRLFRREPVSLFWVLGFPTALLAVLGSIPSFREAQDDLGGLRVIDAYVPVTVLLSMIMAGLQAMPPVVTGYRERGVLRRMSATPVRPSAVLGAQMGLHGAAALGSALLSLAVGRAVFDVPLPRQGLGYALALLLAVAAALALGALVSALARTSKAASAIGSAVFFPMLFSAGVWLPVRAMPDALAHVVEALPFGAAAEALNQAADGSWPGLAHLGVLALWTAALTLAATRWFRWE